MKDIQKYLWLLIVLALIATALPFFRDLYLSSSYGAGEIPDSAKNTWQFISALPFALQNIVAAFWLRRLTLKDSIGKIVWPVFGLFFGLIGVGIYYLVKNHEQKQT